VLISKKKGRRGSPPPGGKEVSTSISLLRSPSRGKKKGKESTSYTLFYPLHSEREKGKGKKKEDPFPRLLRKKGERRLCSAYFSCPFPLEKGKRKKGRGRREGNSLSYFH